MNEVNWPLGNGQSIPFSVHDRNENWPDVPGLYIFTFALEGYWRALYIGQADSLQVRLSNHERLQEAVQNGATHIHATVVHGPIDRNNFERMLIQHLQPPMNVQHRGVGIR